MRPVLCRSVARSVSDDRVYQDLKEKMREYLFSKMKQCILFFYDFDPTCVRRLSR